MKQQHVLQTPSQEGEDSNPPHAPRLQGDGGRQPTPLPPSQEGGLRDILLREEACLLAGRELLRAKPSANLQEKGVGL